MKNQTYQLSQSGIERLQRFKRDILAGDCNVEIDKLYDGSFFCYEVSNGDSVTNCFIGEGDDYKADTIKQIDRTLNLPIEKIKKRKSYFGDNYFYCCVDDGVPLKRSDITTPAQRALEALGDKLNNRSICNA